MADMFCEKTLLRAQMRETLRQMPPERMTQQSKAACGRIAKLAEFERAQTLLAYMAMPRECDPASLVELALSLDKRVAFPLCTEGNMLELYIPRNGAFKSGAYGILEPDPIWSLRISPEDIDLAIVPGVAFDAACNRLGHGAGYYDRLLADTAAVKIGLAFNEQIVSHIPSGALDVRMDSVICENWQYCK